MGFFSWLTSDSEARIMNQYSGKDRPVYLLLPNGREPILETSYEGYGVFGGVDAYELLARENGLVKPGLTHDQIRELGISLALNPKKYSRAKFQLKFSHRRTAKYENLPAAKHDPGQGYFRD
jgi:hypothetical protein